MSKSSSKRVHSLYLTEDDSKLLGELASKLGCTEKEALRASCRKAVALFHKHAVEGMSVEKLRKSMGL